MFGLPSGIKKSSTKAMWQNSPTNVICSDKDLNLQYIHGYRENIKNLAFLCKSYSPYRNIVCKVSHESTSTELFTRKLEILSQRPENVKH